MRPDSGSQWFNRSFLRTFTWLNLFLFASQSSFSAQKSAEVESFQERVTAVSKGASSSIDLFRRLARARLPLGQ